MYSDPELIHEHYVAARPKQHHIFLGNLQFEGAYGDEVAVVPVAARCGVLSLVLG